jgi:hypothetical protein
MPTFEHVIWDGLQAAEARFVAVNVFPIPFELLHIYLP